MGKFRCIFHCSLGLFISSLPRLLADTSVRFPLTLSIAGCLSLFDFRNPLLQLHIHRGSRYSTIRFASFQTYRFASIIDHIFDTVELSYKYERKKNPLFAFIRLSNFILLFMESRESKNSFVYLLFYCVIIIFSLISHTLLGNELRLHL